MNDDTVTIRLPSNFVGQVLDGLDVLIKQWEYTADYLESELIRDDMLIRECSHGHEARSIASFYREIAQLIRE